MKELAWLYAPIAGLLSQIGGSGPKLVRRFVLPIGLALTLIWCQIVWYKAILCGCVVCGVSCLPFTIGQEWKAWYQWVWVWVLGYLLGVGSALLDSSGFLIALVPSAAFGIFGTLSNVPTTAKFFPWKLSEAVFYFSGMYPYLLVATT